jgi:hypothetical protein
MMNNDDEVRNKQVTTPELNEYLDDSGETSLLGNEQLQQETTDYVIDNNSVGMQPSAPIVNQQAPRRFAVHFIATSICLSILVVFFFIWSPVKGLLAVASVAPAVLILFTLFLTRNKSGIDMELVFNMFLSGMLTVIAVLIAEGIISLIIYGILIATGAIDIKQLTDPSAVEKITLSPAIAIFLSFFNAFIVASLVEEVTKWLLAFDLHRRNESRFYKHPFTGMIYAAVGPLGLATIENVGYVVFTSSVLIPTGTDQTVMLSLGVGLFVAVIRTLMAIPLHTTTGCIIGLQYQKYGNPASTTYRSMSLWKFFLYTFVVAYLVHGFYDFLLMSVQLKPTPALLAVGITGAAILIIGSILYAVFLYRQVSKQYRSNAGQSALFTLDSAEDAFDDYELEQTDI